MAGMRGLWPLRKIPAGGSSFPHAWIARGVLCLMVLGCAALFPWMRGHSSALVRPVVLDTEEEPGAKTNPPTAKADSEKPKASKAQPAALPGAPPEIAKSESPKNEKDGAENEAADQ